MKILKISVLTACLLLANSYLCNAQMLKEYSAFHKSIGVSLGSMGVGIEGSYPLSTTFNIRGGGNFFPAVKVGRPDTNTGIKYKYDRSSLNIMIDWQPLYGKESFFASKWFVTAGAGYFFRNELSKYNTENSISERLYTITFKQAPYLGTGLSNLVLGERLGVSLNMGYYFGYKEAVVESSSPTVELPHLSRFPQNVIKGLDVHATISYNF